MKRLRQFAIVGLSSLVLSCTTKITPTIAGLPTIAEVQHLDNQQAMELQQMVLAYKEYLDQYYIYLTLITKQHPRTTVKPTMTDCNAVLSLIKEIELPPPPRSVSDHLDINLDLLISHIKKLRQLIRSNNQYVAQLKKQYQYCQ